MPGGLLPQAGAGDIVIAPPELRHDSLLLGPGGLALSNLSCDDIRVGQCNLSDVLLLAETDRLLPGVLLGDSNFAEGSITSEKLSGPLPVSVGGTGADLASSNAGVVPTAAGTGGLAFDPGLSWDAGSNLLRVSGDVRIGDHGGHRIFVDDADRLSVESVETVVALDGFSLGVPPGVSLTDPRPSYSDSNAILGYSVSGTPPLTLYISWSEGADAPPLLGPDVVASPGAVLSLDGEDDLAGEYTLTELSPITEYAVSAAAVDARGNVSTVYPVVLRTTELSAPAVRAFDGYTYSPNQVGFSVTNEPDTSGMLVVAGLVTDPAMTEQQALDSAHLFFTSNIPAGAVATVARAFGHARDPLQGLAEVAVAEDRAYHPFALYVDSESNSTLAYGTPLYNPDVTPPVVHTVSFSGDSTSNDITVSVTASDAVGVQRLGALALPRGSDAPDGERVMSEGQEVFAGPAAPGVDGSFTVTGLDHTALYDVYVVAEDGSNVSAPVSVEAHTRDGAAPVVDHLEVLASEHLTVSWRSSDAGRDGEVAAVHVSVCNVNPGFTSGAQVAQAAQAAGLSYAGSNGSAVLHGAGTRAYENSYVHVVAEDRAADFGNGANFYSDIRSASVLVPEVTGFSNAYQTVSNEIVVPPGVQADVAETSGGPGFRVLYGLFKRGDETLCNDDALSNVMFSGSDAITEVVITA